MIAHGRAAAQSLQISQANYPVTNSEYYYLVSLGQLAQAAALPKGDVAGENATGYTTTRALPGAVPFVPVQPSFYVKERTLTNLGLTYKEKTWSIGFTCENLADVNYILAAGSRSSLVVGTPRTWKTSFEYKF
jgi:hypothetical protein